MYSESITTDAKRSNTIRIVAAILLVGITGVTACADRSVGAVIRPTPTPTTPNVVTTSSRVGSFQMTKYSEGMFQGITTAQKIITVSESFSLASSTPTFQYLGGPSGDAGLRVFLVTPPGAAPITEVCALWRNVATICDGQTCRSFDGRKAPLVLCNGDGLLALHVLFWLQHASVAWVEATSTDAKYISMLRQIDTDPEGVLAQFKPDTTEHHLTDHWAMLMTFILGHELSHWMEAQSGRAQADAYDARSRTKVPTAVVCRNYDEYSKHGWSVFGAAPEKAEEEVKHLPNGVSLVAVQESRSVWQSEVNADAVGQQEVLRALGLLSKAADEEYRTNLLEDFVGDMFNVSMSLWYRRLDAFQTATCPAESRARFAMIRCMCAVKGRWRMAAGSLLSDSHPPFLFRAMNVIQGTVTKSKLRVTQRMQASHHILQALQDGMIKMAMYGCLLTDPQLDAPMYSEFPALEGSREVAPQGTYPLWPSGEERSEIFRACIPAPKN